LVCLLSLLSLGINSRSNPECPNRPLWEEYSLPIKKSEEFFSD
jgi:hypothetical protein